MDTLTTAVVYPPNRPLERILEPSTAPQLYNFLLFLDINEAGEFALGCSNLSGAYWEGTFFHYKSYSDFIDGKYSGFYISTTSTADAKFIKGTSHVVLAEDICTLKLLNLSVNGRPYIKCEDSFNTNARVEQLAVWDDTYKVLTCADRTVAVWDIQRNTVINPVEEYKHYHTELITSVDVNKSQPNLFVSASFDRKALLWDDRTAIPATVLYENEFSSLTSISWNQAQDEYLAVGTAGGYVYSLDLRQPKEFICSKKCFNAPVHRMSFNSYGMLAICGDTPELLVLNFKDELDVAYRNSEHQAFVRCLAWHGEVLYSCGFDKQIIEHSV